MNSIVLTGNLVGHMGLMGFLGLTGSHRGESHRRGGRKSSADAGWDDDVPAATWSPRAVADEGDADRRRPGRHARRSLVTARGGPAGLERQAEPGRARLTCDGRDPERARVEERHLPPGPN